MTSQTEPGTTAVAILALCLGWPEHAALRELLIEARSAESPEVRLASVAALVARGEKGIELRDDLLELATERAWLTLGGDEEIIESLVTGWADDREVHDACWRGIRRLGGHGPAIDFQTARRLLFKLAAHDERVGAWVAEEISSERSRLYLHEGRDDFLLLVAGDSRVRRRSLGSSRITASQNMTNTRSHT